MAGIFSAVCWFTWSFWFRNLMFQTGKPTHDIIELEFWRVDINKRVSGKTIMIVLPPLQPLDDSRTFSGWTGGPQMAHSHSPPRQLQNHRTNPRGHPDAYVDRATGHSNGGSGAEWSYASTVIRCSLFSNGELWAELRIEFPKHTFLRNEFISWFIECLQTESSQL